MLRCITTACPNIKGLFWPKKQTQRCTLIKVVCYTSFGTLNKKKSQNELLRGRPLDEFIKEPHIHSNTWSISWLSRINNDLIHFYSKKYAKRLINNQLLLIVDKFTKLYHQKRKIITINCYWKAQMLVKEYVLKQIHKYVLVLNQISACGK